MKRLSPGKRRHLLWLVSPQGRKFGSLEALHAYFKRLREIPPWKRNHVVRA